MDVILYYDKKGDNKIDVSQVGTCLRSLGLCPTQAQVNALTQQWDKGEGLVLKSHLLSV